MAYVSKEKKEEIRQAVKKVMPHDWKWSLAVKDYSKAILTISKAPVDLVKVICDSQDAHEAYRKALGYTVYGSGSDYARKHGNVDITASDVERLKNDGLQGRYFAKVFGQLIDAMNTGNYDNSDMMTDYFEVGHYIEVQIGSWKTPFKLTTQTLKAA